MARPTFYYHAKRLNNADGYDDARVRIREIYTKNQGRYGYRRVTAQLHNDGIGLNHKTVQELMLQMGLKARRRKQHYCSYKGQIGKIATNLLDRDFKADRLYYKWTTDITQVKIHDKKIYPSPILDIYNGEIISLS